MSETMQKSLIEYSVTDACAHIHIDNPPVNALSLAAFQELDRCLKQAESDDSVRVVWISGGGQKAFVAGIDIKEVQAFSADEMQAFNGVSGATLSRIEAMNKPVVCSVNGMALGAGFELALACDFRIASENASFGLPELTLGIIPGGGGTQRLTRVIGEARSKEVILLGRTLSAQDAHALGLVTAVTPLEELEAQVQTVLETLVKRPAVAMAAAKHAIQNAFDQPLQAGLQVENQAFMQAFTSADGQEGIHAFAERRRPVFIGR